MFCLKVILLGGWDTAINRGLSSLLSTRVFEVYIILFSWKLIVLAWERVGKHPTWKIRVRAVTFPVKK